MKIVAFGASNSKKSINKQLAIHAANQFTGDIEILDLNDFPLPIYSIDLEEESGIPENAQSFYNKVQTADLLIISLAEHNGSYAAVFKNLLDWLSRIEGKCFNGKKLFLMATSPGARGGASVLEAAISRFPRHGAELISTYSLPSFSENFNENQGITNSELKESFHKEIKKVKDSL